MSLTPNVKSDRTGSLRVNFTINCLLCLLRMQPEINCAYLVHIRARKPTISSYELPLLSPDESPCFRSMQSMTGVIMPTKEALLRGKIPWGTFWVTTRALLSFHAIGDRNYAKEDGGASI